MCGRFTLTADLEFLMERFQVIYPIQFDYVPRFNVAPSQDVTVVIRGERGNKMGQLRWGFVPAWAKDPKIGYKMINARSETAASKASFKQALKRQRCLIPADSFYEWKREKNRKQPYRILLKNKQPFAFAGLWSIWEKDGTTLATCTILTTSANPLVSSLHQRMPVILSPEDEETWLNPNSDADAINQLMRQFPEDNMTYHPVSEAVNSPKNEDSTLIEPL